MAATQVGTVGVTETLGGVELEVRRLGAGPALVYLHGENGMLFCGGLLDRLAERFAVVAPSHPGWGRSVRPRYVTSIDDIAYLYLDVLDELAASNGGPVLLAGTSVGAWLAAEIATKSTAAIAGLVLAAPVGVKFGGRDDRAFVDLYAAAPADVAGALYGRPDRRPDLAGLDDDGYHQLAVNEEAVVRFCWEPYLHNPKLTHRLHRIDVPTIVVTGSADGFVLEADYGAAVAALIGANASARTIDGAGHRLDEEAPDDLAAVVADLADLAAPAERA